MKLSKFSSIISLSIFSITSAISFSLKLTFKSKTSDSVRKVQLMKDRAFLFVNGAIEAYPESERNKTLNSFH